MPKANFIEPTGHTVELEIASGWSLMQAATSNGIEGMDAECGGSCACATCHCYVESHLDQLLPPTATELEMLENVAAERRPNSRLACQLKMSEGLSGVVVRLPEKQI